MFFAQLLDTAIVASFNLLSRSQKIKQKTAPAASQRRIVGREKKKELTNLFSHFFCHKKHHLRTSNDIAQKKKSMDY